MSKIIVTQGIEGSLVYCANGPIELISLMSKTRSKQGIEDKWGDRSNVSKTILRQGIEGSLVYCSNGKIGVISPMSNTRLKKVIENKWYDCSNLYKTIGKQGIEGNLVYCANGPMTIGKSDFEIGVAIYAPKWKTG